MQKIKVQDGIQDCKYSSDELDTLDCLTDTEFQCASTGRCINITSVLDGKLDCRDGSDEPCQSSSEYKCQNSTKCVRRAQVKDGTVDCPYEDDENTTLKCFNATEKVCLSGRCIPANERGHVCAEDAVCADNKTYNCNGANKRAECVSRSKFMDGVADCSNGADEKIVLECYEEEEFRCRDTGRCILIAMVNDNRTDCSDASDEILCDVEEEFKCHRSDVIACIKRRYVNDGTADCGAEEDENVENFECHNGTEVACDGLYQKCFPVSMKNDERCLGENSSSNYKSIIYNFILIPFALIVSTFILA